jgi:hypothetical protein
MHFCLWPGAPERPLEHLARYRGLGDEIHADYKMEMNLQYPVWLACNGSPKTLVAGLP